MGRIKRNTKILGVLVALGVTACAGADSDSSSTDFSVTTDALESEAGSEIADDSRDVIAEPDNLSPAVEQTTAGSRAPSAPLDLDGFGRALAVEAGVVVGTPNIRKAVDDVLIVVRRNNGSVYNADVNIGEEHDDGSIDGSGRLTVKVPPIDLDPLIADLDGTAGTLLARSGDQLQRHRDDPTGDHRTPDHPGTAACQPAQCRATSRPVDADDRPSLCRTRSRRRRSDSGRGGWDR